MHSRTVLFATGAAGLLAGYLLARSDFTVRRLLGSNARLLTKRERRLVKALVDNGHGYLFANWPPAGVQDAHKRRLLTKASDYIAAAGSALEGSRLELLQAPAAKQVPKQLTAHNDVREDSFYWIRDDERSDPDVLSYLNEENAYTQAVMSDTTQLQEQLYTEMRGRIQEADQTAPQRHQQYWYYSRTVEGQQYRVHCRRKIPEGMGPPTESDEMDLSIPEEILLDENKEAEKSKYFMLSGLEVSPDEKLLAYAVDRKGDEKFTLFVQDIQTKKQLLSKPIAGSSGDFTWVNDSKTLFYVTQDQLARPYKVWRHVVGGGEEKDVLVYHEEDEAFFVGVQRSRDDKLLYISSGSQVTSETRYISADEPLSDWRVILHRKQEVEYSASHRDGYFFITLRDPERPNSEVLVASVNDPTAMQVLLPHREDVKIEGICLCQDFLTVFERQQGLQVAIIHKLPADGSVPTALGEGIKIDFDEPAYELMDLGQGDFTSPVLRVGYTSLTTPISVIEYNMNTNNRAVKHVQPVLGGYNPSLYTTERLWAPAHDGEKIPISVVYRKDLVKLDGSDPMLLSGYGSYEICNDPDFQSQRLSLIDRGYVFGIAHIRGGGEMGRRWYEDGKYLKKKNTFLDFISAAEHLIAAKYSSPDRLCISGRSAGGLLIGAVLNMRPELFHAAILGVPFVDVLTTMLDASIPLTVVEWEEWGNPDNPEFYNYMKSYSPVDNVKAQPYPNIMVTAGLHDPRVGYWEPTKLVARLRSLKRDNNLLLFKCDMGAGHRSKSGRFDRLKEVALEYAFLLKCEKLSRAQQGNAQAPGLTGA